jgi:hypothetical protein
MGRQKIQFHARLARKQTSDLVWSSKNTGIQLPIIIIEQGLPQGKRLPKSKPPNTSHVREVFRWVWYGSGLMDAVLGMGDGGWMGCTEVLLDFPFRCAYYARARLLASL